MAPFPSRSLPLLTLALVFTGACATMGARPKPPESPGAEVPASSAFVFDPGGNHIVGGSFSGELAITDGSLKTRPEETSAYVAKVSPGGKAIWAHEFGGDGERHVTGLTIDPQGHVIVSGTFRNEVSLQGERLRLGVDEKLRTGVFAAKLDGASGRRMWMKTMARATMADGAASVVQGRELRVTFRFGGFLQVGQGEAKIYKGRNLAVVDPQERGPMGFLETPRLHPPATMLVLQPVPPAAGSAPPGLVSVYQLDALTCLGLVCWYKTTCRNDWDRECAGLAALFCGWPWPP